MTFQFGERDIQTIGNTGRTQTWMHFTSQFPTLVLSIKYLNKTIIKYVLEKHCWKVITSSDYGCNMLYIVKTEKINTVQMCLSTSIREMCAIKDHGKKKKNTHLSEVLVGC